MKNQIGNIILGISIVLAALIFTGRLPTWNSSFIPAEYRPSAPVISVAEPAVVQPDYQAQSQPTVAPVVAPVILPSVTPTVIVVEPTRVIVAAEPTQELHFAQTCQETKVYGSPVMTDDAVVWSMPTGYFLVIENYSADMQWAKLSPIMTGRPEEMWITTASFTTCP